MPRAERLRLQRERSARLQCGAPARLLRRLFEQRETLLERRARIEHLPELHALIRTARAAVRLRFEFCGITFVVRRGAVFSTVSTANGRHIATFGGAIFDA